MTFTNPTVGAFVLAASAILACAENPNSSSTSPAASGPPPIVTGTTNSPNASTPMEPTLPGTSGAANTGSTVPRVSGDAQVAPTPQGAILGAGGSAETSATATDSSPDTTDTSTSAAPRDSSDAISPTAGNDAGTNTLGGQGNASSSDDSENTADAGGQQPMPARALVVSASPARHEHRFRAKDADSEVSYNDNDQIAILDNRAATLMGKLVLTFGGAGETKGNLTGGGEFCAQRGFHVLAVAAFQAYNIVDSGPDFFGDARRTVFEGVMHTRGDAFANVELSTADGVAQRTQKALEYLHGMNPDEDWGYYLQTDGSVRWSDVIFTGVSHGASNSARFAFLVEASRVVSIAGPRDNLCARVDLNDCGGDVATWFGETPKTPIDRFFAITGVGDDQHTQHLFAMEKLGYVGEPTRIDGAQPPYEDSHRLVSSGGHDDFCGQQSYQATCNYVFGVPAEKHAGTGP